MPPDLVRRAAWLLAAVLASGACAARLPARPAGSSAPDPTAIERFVEATRQCRALGTLTLELRLSGRAAGERVRGSVVAGLEAGGAARLEGLAPFGAPLFILAGRAERATLLLPRERRVLVDASVADVLDRLAGLALGADDLRLVLSGCLVDSAVPGDGRRWGDRWQGVRLGPDRAAYIRERQGAPVVVAADYGAWRVDYRDHANGWPRTVRVRRGDDASIDVTARVTSLEVNVPIDARAWRIDVPAAATPMTLDELRALAPIGPRTP